MSKLTTEFSRFENSQISRDTMVNVLGGSYVGPWKDTVAHSAYPDGDSGRYNTGVVGGIEKDAKG